MWRTPHRDALRKLVCLPKSAAKWRRDLHDGLVYTRPYREVEARSAMAEATSYDVIDHIRAAVRSYERTLDRVRAAAAVREGREPVRTTGGSTTLASSLRRCA